jgi:hypothetical protein
MAQGPIGSYTAAFQPARLGTYRLRNLTTVRLHRLMSTQPDDGYRRQKRQVVTLGVYGALASKVPWGEDAVTGVGSHERGHSPAEAVRHLVLSPQILCTLKRQGPRAGSGEPFACLLSWTTLPAIERPIETFAPVRENAHTVLAPISRGANLHSAALFLAIDRGRIGQARLASGGGGLRSALRPGRTVRREQDLTRQEAHKAYQQEATHDSDSDLCSATHFYTSVLCA